MTCEAVAAIREALVAAFADEQLTLEEFTDLLALVDEAEESADDVDVAIAVSVVTQRRGVRSERRRRLLAELEAEVAA